MKQHEFPRLQAVFAAFVPFLPPGCEPGRNVFEHAHTCPLYTVLKEKQENVTKDLEGHPNGWKADYIQY